MAVAERSGRFPPNMGPGDYLHEDFAALGIRCRSTSLSAPELNCPSMTFSTSSSTTTEAENETPPSSPSESPQATPRLKFAFDENENEDDFSAQKMQRRAIATHSSCNNHGRLIFEAEADECDGYEAGCEGTGMREKKAPMPVVGSLRESNKFSAKKARDRARKVTQQQLPDDNQGPHAPVSYTMLSSNSSPSVPRKPMRFRNRKPSGLSIMVPSVSSDPDTMETSVMRKGNKAPARRPPVRAKTVRDDDAQSSLLKSNEVPSSSAAVNVIEHDDPLPEFQTVKLRPCICDDEPSPIEALPSPMVYQRIFGRGTGLHTADEI